jgi:uncharacterized protein (DUF1501 family)
LGFAKMRLVLIDFRQVYAAILDDWLAVDSKDILGGSFDKPNVLSG